MDNELHNNKTTDEIDLVEVFKKLWGERKFLLKVTGIFFFLGLIIAFGTPKEYKAETILLVETSSGSSVSGLLQQFGGLAGLSLGNQQEGGNLSPEIYPQIVQSVPFLVEIMGEKLHSKKSDSTLTVYEYLSTQVKPSVTGMFLGFTIGLPGRIISAFQKKETPDYSLPDITVSPLKLSKAQEDIMGSLKGRIKITPDETNGTLKISAEMPDQLTAAELTNLVFKYLSKYLIEYKIQKVRNDLDFITKQHEESKARYYAAQQMLAVFRDENKNVTLASFRSEEERFANDYTLAFNIYNGLSQQLEQAKLKVQEKTPVLKVIDPVKVPLNKSKPKRMLIVITMTFVGAITGIGLIFGKMIFVNFKMM